MEMLRCFDGSGSVEVSTWIKKVELVARLKKVGKLEDFLPLYLEGAAFAIYDQLSEEDKASAECIKQALLSAFSQNAFAAYDSFKGREWVPGEAVDVFLADLWRLARLAKVETEGLVRCAFVCGLPTDVSAQLRSSARIQSMALSEVAEQARVLMDSRLHGAMAAVKKRDDSAQPSTAKQPPSCTVCGGENSARWNKRRPPLTCWSCGEQGHIARSCPGNGKGGLPAPAAPPRI